MPDYLAADQLITVDQRGTNSGHLYALSFDPANGDVLWWAMQDGYAISGMTGLGPPTFTFPAAMVDPKDFAVSPDRTKAYLLDGQDNTTFSKNIYIYDAAFNIIGDANYFDHVPNDSFNGALAIRCLPNGDVLVLVSSYVVDSDEDEYFLVRFDADGVFLQTYSLGQAPWSIGAPHRSLSISLDGTRVAIVGGTARASDFGPAQLPPQLDESDGDESGDSFGFAAYLYNLVTETLTTFELEGGTPIFYGVGYTAADELIIPRTAAYLIGTHQSGLADRYSEAGAVVDSYAAGGPDGSTAGDEQGAVGISRKGTSFWRAKYAGAYRNSDLVVVERSVESGALLRSFTIPWQIWWYPYTGDSGPFSQIRGYLPLFTDPARPALDRKGCCEIRQDKRFVEPRVGHQARPIDLQRPDWIPVCTGGGDYLEADDPVPSESWAN